MRKIFVYIWEYSINPEKRVEFENAYNSNGTWVNLFKKGDGHLKTELHQDKLDSNRYITIDYWESFEKYQKFYDLFADQYFQLDDFCKNLTIDESKIGEFSQL